jgi:hypothetical protein
MVAEARIVKCPPALRKAAEHQLKERLFSTLREMRACRQLALELDDEASAGVCLKALEQWLNVIADVETRHP